MAIRILSPKFSFVQFDESSRISNCEWPDGLVEVLPVVEDNDFYFQWIFETDTEAEADTLCTDTGTLVRVSIAESCLAADLILFSDSPERYRLDPTHVLYNWFHGFPLFQTVIDDGDCFVAKVKVGAQVFCSGIFKRFAEACFTSVLEYGNDDNFAGFNYCGGAIISNGGVPVDCAPTEIVFTNVPTVTIPYTALLQSKYGDIPSVQVWIYDTDGSLVDMGIRVELDGFPPSTIFADFGGTASGILKIS